LYEGLLGLVGCFSNSDIMYLLCGPPP